jgi:hypothetical protein
MIEDEDPLLTYVRAYDLTVSSGLLEPMNRELILTFVKGVSKIPILLMFRDSTITAIGEQLDQHPVLIDLISRVHARWLTEVSPAEAAQAFVSVATALVGPAKPQYNLFGPALVIHGLAQIQAEVPQDTKNQLVGQPVQSVAVSLLSNNTPLFFAATVLLRTAEFESIGHQFTTTS